MFLETIIFLVNILYIITYFLVVIKIVLLTVNVLSSVVLTALSLRAVCTSIYIYIITSKYAVYIWNNKPTLGLTVCQIDMPYAIYLTCDIIH